MLTELRTNLRTPRRWPGESDRVRARTSDELDVFEARWPSDAILSSGPSSSFGWLRAARIAFSESAEVQVLAAECHHRVLAAAALVGVRRGGILRQTPLGSELGQPADVASQDARGLRCLADALVRSGEPLCFDRLPTNSPSIDAIRNASLGRAIAIVRPTEPITYLALDESWIVPERHLLPRERRRLDRVRQRAERIGPVSIEIHTPDLEELPRLLDVAFELHESKCHATNDHELVLQLGKTLFFRQYAEAACVSGSLRICLLRIGDRVAATQIGVEGDDTFWLLMAEADPRFARSQPSQLLAREVIKYCAEAHLSSYALWGPKQPWMQAWPVATQPCAALNVYPLRIRGLAALGVDGVMAIYRRVTQLAKRR
jgi:CelD/BcsL family acetyltransferase involved in cellulose biosynthesis